MTLPRAAPTEPAESAIQPAETSGPIDARATAGTTEGRLLAPARSAAIQGKAVEVVTQLLLVVALPRMLGPSLFGELTLALTVVTLASVGISLGAPSAFARFIPAAPAERRAGLARAMSFRLLRIRGMQLAATAALGTLLVIVAPGRFTAMDMAVVVVALAVEVVAVLAAQVALGIGRTWVWSFRIAIKNAALLLAVPLLLRLAGPVALLPSLVISSAAGLVFAGWTVAGIVRHAERGVAVPDGATRYGVVAGLAFLADLVTYRGPVLAASALAGSAIETGFAALAVSIAMAIMLAVRELYTVSMPELVEQWGRDEARADALLRRLGRWSQGALIAGALVGTLALPRGLPLVVGDQFAAASRAMVPILVLLPLLPLPLLGWQAASLRLRPEMALAVNATGCLVLVAASAAVVPLWGAAGATAALLLAVVASSVLAAWTLPTVVDRRLFISGVVAALMVAALAAATGLLR